MRLLSFLLLICSWLNFSFAADFDDSVRCNKHFSNYLILNKKNVGWEHKNRILKELKKKAYNNDEHAFDILIKYDKDICYLFVDENLKNPLITAEKLQLFLDYLDRLAVKGHRKAFSRVLHLVLSHPYPIEGLNDREKTIKFLVDFLVNDIKKKTLKLVKEKIIMLGGLDKFIADSRLLVENDVYRQTIELNLSEIRKI